MPVKFKPTQVNVDRKSGKKTVNNFYMFIENYPIAIIAKIIKEWISQKDEYPTIAELRSRIENALFRTQNKLNRLEKIILSTKGGGRSVQW